MLRDKPLLALRRADERRVGVYGHPSYLVPRRRLCGVVAGEDGGIFGEGTGYVTEVAEELAAGARGLAER